MYKLLIGVALAFLLAACEKERTPAPDPVQKSFPLSGFTRIHAGETYHVTVKHGATFSVLAKGSSDDLRDLVATIEQGNILSLRYNGFKPNRYRVDIEITLPLLIGLHLTDAAKGSVQGFGQQTSALKVVLAADARCTVNQLPVLVDVFLSANSELTLQGTSGDLLASLLANAKLHAYEATFDDADVYTMARSTAKIKVLKSLTASASDNSRVYYQGAPAHVSVEELGLGKVIRE
ncbi:MAG: DUF2807 domain-containing protein [Bacteroidota bacterium]|nr:DUF2807 domain-containing protein [Bacteroidota bacterium]